MAHAESQKMYTGVATNEDPNGATSASRKSPEALKPIYIRGLEPFLGRPAYGHVLLITLIHAPCQQVAIQMLVEDGEGTAINMSLYNVVPNTGKCSPDLLKVFPVGTRLAIKDPYLKIYTSGMPGLRVDHIGNVLGGEGGDGGDRDVVPLKESKEYMRLFVKKERGKDAGLAKLTEIKEKGNAFLAKKDVSADNI